MFNVHSIQAALYARVVAQLGWNTFLIGHIAPTSPGMFLFFLSVYQA